MQAKTFAKLRKTASTYSFDGKTEPTPLYEEDVVKEEDILADQEPSRIEITQEDEGENEEDVELGSCGKFQLKMRTVVNHSAFETLITLCILFNTLAMALEHHEMDQTFADVLEVFNLVCHM